MTRLALALRCALGAVLFVLVVVTIVGALPLAGVCYLLLKASQGALALIDRLFPSTNPPASVPPPCRDGSTFRSRAREGQAKPVTVSSITDASRIFLYSIERGGPRG